MRLGAFFARGTRTMRLCSSDARSRRQPSPIPWMDDEGGDLIEGCQAAQKGSQRGRRGERTGGVPSGAHGATNKEHHVCARRRVGEAAGSPLRILSTRERSWVHFSAA